MCHEGIARELEVGYLPSWFTIQTHLICALPMPGTVELLNVYISPVGCCAPSYLSNLSQFV